VAETVPAATVKFALTAPLATETELGVVSTALLSERVTVVLPDAALLRVTVQVPEAPEPNVAGVHFREESVSAAARLKVADFETLPRVAVMTAD
jgi:hypothetical protein